MTIGGWLAQSIVAGNGYRYIYFLNTCVREWLSMVTVYNLTNYCGGEQCLSVDAFPNLLWPTVYIDI